jgi:hypothetical protein
MPKYFKKIKIKSSLEGGVLDKEDQILLEGIQKLENKFGGLSKDKGKIVPKSFTIIGKSEIYETDKQPEPEFNDRYVSDEILFSFLNEMENVKILGRDFSSLSAVRETKNLHDEGYIDLNKEYKHNMPEYYFLIDPVYSSDSIVFNLKILSLENKIVNLIDSEKYLFYNNSVEEKEKVMKDLVIPNLINSIKGKIQELGLNSD